MHRQILLLLALALAVPSTAPAQGRQATTMPAFTSDSALTRFLQRLIDERQERIRRERRFARMNAAASPMGAAQGFGDMAAASPDGITNNQNAGVDEGGIVKLRGDYLVILRRGRLFTVAVGGNGELRPAATRDAFGPGINPGSTWYDEMLIAGDRVVVMGYSYERGGTEVGIFRLGTDGALSYVTTFQLRSNDYYSSRNYAARLVGTKLVFYAPLYLPWNAGTVAEMLPAVQRWSASSSRRGFQTITRPERVYRPAGWQADDNVALHTVTTCELDSPDVACQATVVVGPPGQVFYVSQGAVYVWMSGGRSRLAGNRTGSLLARIPLDGSAPSATGVAGSPVDQFSFHESEDGFINVLTRGGAAGGAMWMGEQASGATALLRMPVDSMSDGSRLAPSWWYRALQSPSGHTMQNRFVGNYLLYGTGSSWGGQASSDQALYVVPWRGGDAATLRLPHGTDRIEVMGDRAIVVGVKGADLEFTGISLRARPRVAQRFTMPNASQGELRSHGFFYRADGADAGVLGLPIREAGRRGSAHLTEGSASILFLRNGGGQLTQLGKLEAGEVRRVNDNCRASCVDWYGNARPIFARGRVFALMGYEIVEGQVDGDAIRELRRTSFQPGVDLTLR